MNIKELLQIGAPLASLVVTLLLLLRESGHKEGVDDAGIEAAKLKTEELKSEWQRKSKAWHDRFDELQRWQAAIERTLLERVESHYMPRREAEVLLAEFRRAIEDLRERVMRREK